MTRLRKKLVSAAVMCCVLVAGCTVRPGPEVAARLGSREGECPLPLGEGTRRELAARGLPSMPTARRLACGQTSRQSVPAVIVDLGNILVSDLCSVCVGTWAAPSELERYYRQMLNVKVLRLIEEGREDRGTVSRLLHDTVGNCLADFEQAGKACLEAMQQGRLPAGVRWDDPYYEKHGRYEHPVVEFDRLHDVTYMSFYVLANIEELRDPNLLARWIGRDGPQWCHCPDMDVWLVDSYFGRHGKGTKGATGHAALTKGLEIAGRTVRQSRWNAAWDVHDPLLTSRRIDTSDIQTIEVLEIPRKCPDALDQKTKEQIIRNFLEFAASQGTRA